MLVGHIHHRPATIPSRHYARPGASTMHEHFFRCPVCWQRISMLLDLSVRDQVYVEDCEVCCRPLQIRYRAREHELISFDVEPVRQ